MARRLGILALIVGFGAVAYWAVGQRVSEDTEGGLVVHVLVLDEDGKPVRGAQVRRRLSQTPWETVDGAGRIRLRDVPLHADHEPSAKSLAAALSVRARFLGVRDVPQVKQADDGWHVTYTLAPHGVLRLAIEPTHLAPVKAWLEPDPLGRYEAMGTTNVARLDQDAAFRVQPELDEVVVRVEGEPDPLGSIRAATQRLVFPAPRPGVISHARVDVMPARPITGVARAQGDDGPVPVFGPDVEVVVRTIENDAPAHELGRVPVKEKSGRFLIPFAGRGPYALTLHAPRREPGPMRVAAGESDVTLFAGRIRAWVRFEHPELDPKRRQMTIALMRPDGRTPRVVGALRRERTWTQIEFADAPGPLTFHARVAGTNREPPLEAAGEMRIEGAGETRVELDLQPSAHGTVELALAEGTPPDRVANIRLGARKLTLISEVRPRATLKHVFASPRTELTARWKDPSLAVVFEAHTIAPDEVQRLTIAAHPGGHVQWHGPPAKEILLTWRSGASPYGDIARSIALRRHGEVWRTHEALRPGRYEAHIGQQAVRFEIRAGETVTAVAR